MKKAIIGAGGFGREVYWGLSMIDRVDTVFFVDDKYFDGKDELIKPLSEFNPLIYEVIVAIGDPTDRYRVVKSLPNNTRYFTHIHPTAQIHGLDIQISEGSIICAGTIITTNVKIGKHAHLNLQTTIGHDCVIGDYFTTAPGAKVSGNCNIGDFVYMGTNACIREKINICDLVTIGLNAGVVKDIIESGVYTGTPSKRIK